MNLENPKYRAMQEGYPPYLGKLVAENKQNYFAFEVDDVTFLIAPQCYTDEIDNPHGFSIEEYENVV